MHERSDDNPYPKHSISLGGIKLANGKELYIGEYRSSIEEKFCCKIHGFRCDLMPTNLVILPFVGVLFFV